MEEGQLIYHYVVDVIFQKKGRTKKPVTYKAKNFELISRAKNLDDINRDKKATSYLKKQVYGTPSSILTFRAYKIVKQKEIGRSTHHKEQDYRDEFN